MTNDDVAHARSTGMKAKNYRQSLHTDGVDLYSYDLQIGSSHNGQRVLYAYRAPHFVSQTTSCHVGIAEQYADVVTAPPIKPSQLQHKTFRQI